MLFVPSSAKGEGWIWTVKLSFPSKAILSSSTENSPQEMYGKEKFASLIGSNTTGCTVDTKSSKSREIKKYNLSLYDAEFGYLNPTCGRDGCGF